MAWERRKFPPLSVLLYVNTYAPHGIRRCGALSALRSRPRTADGGIGIGIGIGIGDNNSNNNNNNVRQMPTRRFSIAPMQISLAVTIHPAHVGVDCEIAHGRPWAPRSSDTLAPRTSGTGYPPRDLARRAHRTPAPVRGEGLQKKKSGARYPDGRLSFARLDPTAGRRAGAFA